MKGKVKRLVGHLKSHYKILISKADTSLEKPPFIVPLWTLISIALTSLLVVFVLFIVLLRFTSLKEYIIGENPDSYRRELLKAYERIDSLDQLSAANELYLSNLQKVMGGKVGESIDEAIKRDSEQLVQNDKIAQENPKGKRSSEDEEVLKSLLELRNAVLSEQNIGSRVKERSIADYTFYSPVKGVITSAYDKQNRHFATDIATKMNEPIQSILDGHVIFSSFTPSTGYVIIVQHSDNLISVYKHCAALLKKEGVFVKGGEVIALAGNTGELTTGPHLHFELWYNGNAVNAEDYINF